MSVTRARRAATRACAIGLVAALSGCAPIEPLVELGTGQSAFEPIEDGQDLPMIEGAQGGWHLWISVRTQGIGPRGARIELELSPREAGRPRQTRVLRLDLEPHDGWHALVGLPMVMSLPECFQDREVLMRASVVDAEGRTEGDERVVFPRWHEPIGTCSP